MEYFFIKKTLDKLLILWYNIIKKEAMPNERVKTPTKCVNKKLCQDPIYKYYLYRVWVQFLRQWSRMLVLPLRA